MSNLKYIDVFNFSLQNGKTIPFLGLSYQLYGKPIGTAPVIVINHALTGNSNVFGEKGWWKELVATNKTIDLNSFTVICFNIPGNGYSNTGLIQNYTDFTTKDIANIFWEGLDYLGVKDIFAIIGGSLGGGIAWEMTFLRPKAVNKLIVIATHWKANDWLIANVKVQDQILNNSENPIHNARAHAMLLYRTPQSLEAKFKTEKVTENQYKIESWLDYHGEALSNRFQLKSYKLMNYLLKTIGENMSDTSFKNFLKETKTEIHQIYIDSDYFFVANDNKKTHSAHAKKYKNMYLHEINSIHGHDAFLLEYNQLNTILKPILTTQQNYYQYENFKIWREIISKW